MGEGGGMNFERLEVWKEAFALAVCVHSHMKRCRDYGFRDQILRCSVSIPSNIAEGIERGTNKDTVRFLYYAKGSTGELLTQLQLGVHFGYIPECAGEELSSRCHSVAKMLNALIAYRSKHPNA